MNLIQILGYGLTPEGKITPILLERLKKGLELLNESPNSKVIVSGGNAPNHPQENQAKAMQKWLLGNDIAPDRIILEDQSINTVEQLLFLYKHLQENNYDEISIVGTEGGFDRRIRLIRDFLFPKENRNGIRVEGATLPEGIGERARHQFSEGEKSRIQTIRRISSEFKGDPVKALIELATKYREGSAGVFLQEAEYELSTANMK